MAWIVIGSTVIGGVMANSAANKQSKAIKDANAANNRYLDAAFPYMEDNLETVTGYYNQMRAKGPYTGDFYADPNKWQKRANESMFKTGNANAKLGQEMSGLGMNMMNKAGGFVDNASSLYDQYSNLATRPDMMAKADQYAQDNMSPIVKAMMRDDTRKLEEQTLPGINMGASGSGNANSSRAGVATAIAERGYNDRLADVSTDVYNSLRDASLTQSNTEFGQSMDALSGAGNANTTLAGAYNDGMNAATTGANLSTTGVNTALGAGNNRQLWEQGGLDADRAQWDYLNSYNYNLGKDYMGFLSGNNVSGNYMVNNVDPFSATIGGGMTGYGIGMDLYSRMNQGAGNNIVPTTPNAVPRPQARPWG